MSTPSKAALPCEGGGRAEAFPLEREQPFGPTRGLHDMGCSTIVRTDHVLALIADGPTASLACGWMEGDGQASFSNGDAGQRNVRQTRQLDPMLARLAVNHRTARQRRQDLMTGTGFLIEVPSVDAAQLALMFTLKWLKVKANLAWAHGGKRPVTLESFAATPRLGDVLPSSYPTCRWLCARPSVRPQLSRQC